MGVVTGNPTGRPPKWTDPVAFEMLVDEYLLECEKNGDLPTHAGLALHCGTCKGTIVDYSKKAGFAPAIKKLDDRQEGELVRRLWTGKNPVPAIFLLKCLRQYRENDTSAVTVNVQADARLAPELEDALAKALDKGEEGEADIADNIRHQ